MTKRMADTTKDPQEQFLDVIDRDEATRRFQAAIRLQPLPAETIRLQDALGRVLAVDVISTVDVPSFDRSNLDGYAVIASDTFGAQEEQPRQLRLLPEIIATAVVPQSNLQPGQAVAIATGGMLPRGADAIVMVEHADREGELLNVRNSVTPGRGITFAGTDVTMGETVLRRGQHLTSRETGVLAAIGADALAVYRQPRVAILSTGDEIVAPDQAMRPGLVFDSNAQILADTVREIGGVPVRLGIVGDEPDKLEQVLREAFATCDVVLLSGGTSKGAGDICYRVVSEITEPGVVVHGVALKPGKPICLASHGRKPVVILPGFPTSAIFTFHEFVAPVVRALAGLQEEQRGHCMARIATKVNSEIGRQEYLLVGLVPASDQDTGVLAAYPMGKGSGSVTTFSCADGFITLDRHQELLDAGTEVDVRLLGHELEPADLVVIGSHCVVLDRLLSQVHAGGATCKFLAVGSHAGLEAARRGECDLAGIHLLDPVTETYNRPFLTDDLELIAGYRRRQGIVFRSDDPRFQFDSAQQALATLRDDTSYRMVNRNQGSGTRILIDLQLQSAEPPGYAVQPRSHQAVAVSVAQGRADWGVAIQWVAEAAGLGFLPLADEHFDFVVPRSRRDRAAVKRFKQLLKQYQDAS